MIILKLKAQITDTIPREAESINPENIRGKTDSEISALPIWCGNRLETVGDYFDVDTSEASKGDLSKIVLQGDLSLFKRLGQGMTEGEMEIQSSVGFHAGSSMKGGLLTIKGDAGDWLGSHMEGGRILVEGSVGHYVGAAQRGRPIGMQGGTIMVKGNAGQMLGSRMGRGLIAVEGDCGDVVGFKMVAGTIVVRGKADRLPGANMARGTIVILQRPRLLPTFYYSCEYRPVMWKLIYEELRQNGFDLDESYRDAVFARYTGDVNTGGKGEILICQSN